MFLKICNLYLGNEKDDVLKIALEMLDSIEST